MSNPGQNATLEELNRKEDQILGQLQRHLPRTYQLLAGIRFEVPPQRAADYVHYGYAVYENARMLLETAAEREGRADSLETWTAVAGSCGVLNEWLKRGQTTLFVERELGEALKRTDLPGGFCPKDLRWRWTAFRLVLPSGLFRVQADGIQWDVFTVTLVKVPTGELLDLHPTLAQEAQAKFGGKPRRAAWPEDEAIMFYIQRRLGPEHKQSRGTLGVCKLDERTLRTLAEEIEVDPASRSVWTPDMNAFATEFQRFLFNVLLFLGSLPEEYEPDQVLRPGREKKGRFKPELRAARFLGKELYRPAPPPSGPHQPTGRKLPGHWRAGHWRRQTYGPQSSLRKLIWIQPYKTTGPESDA